MGPKHQCFLKFPDDFTVLPNLRTCVLVEYVERMLNLYILMFAHTDVNHPHPQKYSQSCINMSAMLVPVGDYSVHTHYLHPFHFFLFASKYSPFQIWVCTCVHTYMCFSNSYPKIPGFSLWWPPREMAVGMVVC